MRLILVTIFSILFLFNSNFIYSENIKKRGTVTGLEIPRFVSLKKSRTFLRRGPGKSYKIDWIYTRVGIPLKIDAEYGNWRRVIDFQGEGGWVHSRLLSGKRHIIFLKSKAILKRKPNKKSPPVAIIQKGVIAKLISSDKYWSEISTTLGDAYSKLSIHQKN